MDNKEFGRMLEKRTRIIISSSEYCRRENNKKSVDKSLYWLEIIDELNWIEQKQLQTDIAEANEILSIFASIDKSLQC